MAGTADSIMFPMKREKGKVFGEWGERDREKEKLLLAL